MPGKEVVLPRGREQDVRNIKNMKAQSCKKLRGGGRERDEAGETGRGEMIEVFFAENWGEVHVKLTGTGVIAIGFTFWKSIFLRNCGGQWTPRLSRVRKEAVECRWAFLTLERASPGGLDKTQVLPQSFWVSRSGARSHNLYF